MILTFIAGMIFAHLFWLLVVLLIVAWENRGGITYRKRPSDP